MRLFLAAVLCSVSFTAAQASEPAILNKIGGNAVGKVNIVPASAPVVEISDKSGPVTRVNRGNGLKDAKVGDSLNPGDEVFAGLNSSIVLYFTQAQCSYKVKGSSVYKVTDKAPCKAAAGAGAGAGAGAAAGVGAGVGVGTGVALGVGAVVLGGAVAVIATTDNNNNNKKPTTPD